MRQFGRNVFPKIFDFIFFYVSLSISSFVTKYSLKSHVKLVHERYYEKVCHICAKVYVSSTSFRLHMDEHNETKPPRIDCKLCGKSYKNIKSLRSHMTIHKDGDRIFQCPQCLKISPNRHALSKHIRVTHNCKVYTCSACGKECKSMLAVTVRIQY